MIIRHISSYIRSILLLAISIVNIGIHKVCAEVDVFDFTDPSKPFKITSAEEFIDVFDSYNHWLTIDLYPASEPFCLSLENDIDMEGLDFTPIQTETTALIYFEGNGHSIKNLKFTGFAGKNYSGLFPVLQKASYIRNIKFENVDATLPSKSCGVISGYISGKIDLSNTYISGKVSYTYDGDAYYIGGVIGGTSNITGLNISDVTVDLDYDLPESARAIGGVIGYINYPEDATLSNIVNRSKSTMYVETSKFGVGGIFGFIQFPSNLSIHDCANYMNIESASPITGGIIGSYSEPPLNTTINELYNCTNSGNINSSFGDVGGIAGLTQSAKIYNCINIGNVSSSNPNKTTDRSDAGVGGIVGSYIVHNIVSTNNTLLSCINMGYISVEKEGNAAGIVGYYLSEDSDYNESDFSNAAKIFPFHNCLSLSSDGNNRIVKKFLFNTKSDYNCIGGLYADSSYGASVSNDSVHYLSNSTLISGNVPFYYYSSSQDEGFWLNNEDCIAKGFEPAFEQKPGYYPYLPLNDDIARLASLPIILADGESLDSIASGFTCVMTDGVVWSSAKGNFTVSDDGVVTILGAGEDTIYGVLGNAVISHAITLYKNVFGGGRGTEENPYLLQNIAHLEELRDSLATKEGWSKNKFFKVSAHISGLDFALSPSKQTRFMGYLDGAGYSIKMNIANKDADAALFVYTENASIHDLQTSGSVAGKDNAAGVCANAINCDIYNCFNSAKISGDCAAGIVANSTKGNLYGLCNSGTISGSTFAGGVIGKVSDIDGSIRISDLVNSGYVTGKTAAGLIGDAERLSASYAFNRLINYGSVCGSSEAYPYIFTSQFSGYSYKDSYYDIQITRNGKCATGEFPGASIGTDIMPTTSLEGQYMLFPADENAVFVPSFVIGMRNCELLGMMPTFENEELSSFVQTSPSLLSSGRLKLHKIGDSEEYTKLSDLVSTSDVPALLYQKSEFDDVRETYITIASIPFSSGDGSADDPYLISNLADLQSLADLIEANKVTDKYYVTSKENNWSYNKHFKLTADILGDGTASSIVTDAIASVENPFQGVFDGDGHTIKISINNQNRNYQALFASIESGAVIENLIVTGIVKGKMCVAGVVASATAQKTGDTPIIRNVINVADVTSSSEAIGGICGKSSAVIEDCANSGNITITLDSNPYYTGGIVGYTSANITRCVNTGNVYGHRRVGGICGAAMSDGAQGLVMDCINYGMVYSQCPPSADYAYLGGVVGSADKFDIKTSLNLNRVWSRNTINVDAVVGSLTNGDVKDCYYDKQVSVLSSEYATGLLTNEFSDLPIDAFNYNSGLYPTLNSPLSKEKLPTLASSSLNLFINEDKTVYDEISKVMNYGDVNVADNTIKWTSKNGTVEVVRTEDGYVVKPLAVGSDTLTASYGIFSKQISIDIFCIPVRLDTTITGCQMVSVRKSDGSEIICTKDTVFTEVYPRENTNCDSTIKYIVKINKLTDYLIDTVLCAKSALSGAAYRGNIYNNTDYITLKDTVDCDSAITTKLRVVIPRVDSTYYNAGCDSVFCEVDGKFHYESASFYDTLKSKKCGCDSVIIKVNLNVTNSGGYEFDEVYLDSFIVNGKKLKGGESTTVYDTLVTKHGCDSIVKKNIYVYDRVYKMDTVLYACEYYLDKVNSKKITRDTILVEELSETLHGIKVDGYYLQKRDVRISHNTSADTTKLADEYYCNRYLLTEKIDGVEHVIANLTKDTVVYNSIPRDKKCDSILVRTIHILPAPVMDTVEFVNCGDFYDEELDTTFTSSQDYIVTEKYNNSVCDCDSFIQLRRYSIRITKHNNINISGCSEAEYTFYGSKKPKTFTSSIDTVEVIRYKSGPVCDSVINNIHIVVANPIYDTVRKSTCGDTIMYLGKVYFASDGDYKETITYTSAAGCDSLIRTLDFRFVETIEEQLPTKYGCDSVVCDINHKTYYEDYTVSVQVGTTAQGCPIFNTQNLVVLHPTTTQTEVMGCEFAEFNGKVYYENTTLQLKLKSTLCDCDSFVDVKIMVLPRIESPTIYLTDCDSVMINDPDNGVVVIKDDVDDYQCMYQKVYNIEGNEYICDSIVHYNVHVKKPTYNSVVITGESSVEYKGETYRRSRVIRDTLVNAEGCDSFIEIKLVVEKDLGYPVIIDKFGYTLLCNNNIGNVKFTSYQWFKDGEAISGATKEYYEGAQGEKLNGCYHVEVTNGAGKEFVSETYCIDKERELVIYPNPVSPDEILTIDYPFTDEEKENLRVQVYDAMGIMVREFVPTSYPIQMDAALPAGYYFILINESDERMLDARFIVR